MEIRKRIVLASVPMMIFGGFLAVRLSDIITDKTVISASSGVGTYTVGADRGRRTVYDRNMKPMLNIGKKYFAVINPLNVDPLILKHIIDHEKFRSGMTGNTPFLCEIDCGSFCDTPVIGIWNRYPSPCPAQHILGYTSEGGGVSGIEAVYDDFLSKSCQEKIVYKVNALGQVLLGEDAVVTEPDEDTAGIVLSLDSDIQSVCENAMGSVEKGAAVVMDVRSGEILASVSRPVYDIDDLGKYLDDENAPFVNRAFSAYGVGSVFKTVIAASALESGISEEYTCRCTGSIMIKDQRFGCHLWGGHGDLDMRGAMIESCNPYFISLGRNIPDEFLYDMMISAGFGSSCDLGGIKNSAGYIPDISELSVPAEKANLCFGQGKLTASPLQICRFVCAIANSGALPEPQLVLGTVSDKNEYPLVSASYRIIFSAKTAEKLRSFMHDALMKPNSLGIPSRTDGGGKTSTAQTGRFDEEGNEYMNCWFAGFFPYDEPRYAVVVMAEEGQSGNITCAPVFKDIADNITKLENIQ